MTNIRKQVMFYLKIQSSNIPREPATAVSKIGCCEQLVYRPVIFEGIIVVRQRKFCAFCNVGRLKYNSEYKASNIMHHQYTDQDLPPRKRGKDERQNEDVTDVKYFG